MSSVEKGVAVAVLQLQLTFFVVLRGPSWTKGFAVDLLQLQLPFFAVLRGPSRIKGFAVDLLQLPFQKLPSFATLRGQ